MSESEYGVTREGFVLKRMDTILEEIHTDLTEGFGFDTRLIEDQSFLNVLIMTAASQLADLWETAQDSYYAKFVSTASGLNLDYAVQYGGIKRMPAKRNSYPLHCTGDDGTVVPDGAVVATNTNPQIRLFAESEFIITRENCASLSVVVAVQEAGTYTVYLNGTEYSYTSESSAESEEYILTKIAALITDPEYTTELVEDELGNFSLSIADTVLGRSNNIILSDNLTTACVTTVGGFLTEEYGKITIPNNLVTVMVTNIAGFNSVTNILTPIYGRDRETDTELRHAYMQKKAIRSNTMIGSIVAELMNSIDGVESASGYENPTDETDERGLPPHSIEMVVDGGDSMEIAQAILYRKAGGIQSYGNTTISLIDDEGETIPIRFSRPQYLYVWLKIGLYGNLAIRPINFSELVIESITDYGTLLTPGDDLLVQLLLEGIYESVAGVAYVDIKYCCTEDPGYVPSDEEYQYGNIEATPRQKILIAESRIEVSFSGHS